MNCRKCGNQIDDGSKFCEYCGASVEMVARKVFCENCGSELNGRARFCQNCGVACSDDVPGTRTYQQTQYQQQPQYHQQLWQQLNGIVKTRTLLSLGILISFFLTWITFEYVEMNAFKIPSEIENFESLGILFGEDMSYLKLFYLLYLLPIFAIYNIIVDLSMNKKMRNIGIEFALGIIFPIILFIIVSIGLGELEDWGVRISPFKVFGIGYYLTVIFSITGIINGFRK